MDVFVGLRPLLAKGIQAALTRRSDPPLTKLAPLSPRGKAAVQPSSLIRVLVGASLPFGPTAETHPQLLMAALRLQKRS
jgi:hypothetical protein